MEYNAQDRLYELLLWCVCPFLSLTVPGQPSFTFIVLKGVAIYSFCVPRNKGSDYYTTCFKL